MSKYFNLIIFILVISVFAKETPNLMRRFQNMNEPVFAHVLLYLPDANECGGTIISSKHVLTAANCLVDAKNGLIDPHDVTIATVWNSVNGILLPSITNITVAAIYVHPHFNVFYKHNDIAVLRLEKELPEQQPHLLSDIAVATLNTRIVPDDMSCSIAVFNKDNEGKGLKHIKLLIVNREMCSTIEVFTLQIKSAMICGKTTTSTSLCQQDLGSGMYCNGLLSGVLSFGGICDVRFPGIFTQTRMYNKWIGEQLPRLDIPRAGPLPYPRNSSFLFSVQKFLFLSLVFIIIYLM